MNLKKFIGVDFSGAAYAGKTIWLASGIEKNGFLHVFDCRRAESLPGSGLSREACFNALQDYLIKQGEVLAGFDFPFGLPRLLVKEKNWERFVLNFPARYNSPEQFRSSCYERAGGKEYKRVADYNCRAPFSPYNLRVYKQTYYGIKDLLNPLVRLERVSVLPMQEVKESGPLLIEVCPASTLKAANLYFGYKGRGEEKQDRRLKILNYLETERKLVLDSAEMRDMVVRDRGGDALDSLVALVAGFEARASILKGGDMPGGGEWKVEGHTYY